LASTQVSNWLIFSLQWCIIVQLRIAQTRHDFPSYCSNQTIFHLCEWFGSKWGLFLIASLISKCKLLNFLKSVILFSLECNGVKKAYIQGYCVGVQIHCLLILPLIAFYFLIFVVVRCCLLLIAEWTTDRHCLNYFFPFLSFFFIKTPWAAIAHCKVKWWNFHSIGQKLDAIVIAMTRIYSVRNVFAVICVVFLRKQ